jgi:tetratricopeptide (TPR) repeat protein
MMLVLQASVRLWDGRSGEAVERAEEALAIFERLDDDYGRLQSTGVLGRALVSAGRIGEALGCLGALRDIEHMTPTERERLFHGMALAGSANAMGDLSLAAGVLEGAEVTSASDRAVEGELAVSLALHLAQRGEPERAHDVLATGCAVEVEGGGGNATAVAAVVHAALGDLDGAIGAAERVRADDRSTYIDRMVAGLAQALALMAREDAAGCGEVLARTAAMVDATDDVLAQAVVRLAAARLAAAGGPAAAVELARDAEERLATLGIDAEGWRRLFDTALRGSVSSAAS